MTNLLKFLHWLVLCFLVFFVTFLSSLLFFKFFYFYDLKRSENSNNLDIYNLKNSKDEKSKVSLFLAGDVMLGRSVMIRGYKDGDFVFPFKWVANALRSSDIAFFNLESPIIDSCPMKDSGYIFCTSKSFVEGLKFSGVDVVNLANNHIENYGKNGLDQTIRYLSEAGILTTGVGKLVKIEKKGLTFGFLGFDKSEQVNPKLNKDEVDLILESDKEVDILVVSMHWGVEYRDRALESVRILAKEIMEYGADVIMGHHPHWVQDWDFINGKPVFYSLGNFVFDQMWSEETKKGLAVELIYDVNGNISDYKLMPTYMVSVGQPKFINAQ